LNLKAYDAVALGPEKGAFNQVSVSPDYSLSKGTQETPSHDSMGSTPSASGSDVSRSSIKIRPSKSSAGRKRSVSDVEEGTLRRGQSSSGRPVITAIAEELHEEDDIDD
jgi:hypothetical protein